MISVAAVSSAGDAATYYAKDNYYTADQHEGASVWVGRGASELGLGGSVDAASFERVLAGALPDGSTIDAKRGDHRPGWDLTMSASKSVSILALVGGDQRLVDAVRGAALATLGWVERTIAEARTWNGRTQEVERTGKLIAATFLHDVNRNGEPQLHVHAVIANATRTADGKWHALRSDELYNRQHVMGAVFNAELRARVERLGYATIAAQNPRDGAFEIAAVPRHVVDAFSTRSAEIGAHLAAEGRQGTARERELAALSTRGAKTPALSPEMRGEGWRALAAKCGLSVDELATAAVERAGRGETIWSRLTSGLRNAGERGLAVAARMGLTPQDGDPLVPERLGRLEPHAFAAAQAVASAVRDLGEREAAFDRLDLIRAALERGGPVTAADIEARIGLLETKRLLLGDGDRMVTTDGAFRLEQAHLAAVEAGKGASAPIVPGREAAIRAQDVARELGLRRLNPGQEAAATLILASSDRVVNVQGGPGRGKSAVLAPVVTITKAEGRNVIGLAVASRTARALGRETGAEASTVAGFLARHARVIDGEASPAQVARATEALAGAVLLLDEASQVGTCDMERLTRLANLTGVARLVQVGDTRQLGAVDAGKPFALSQAAGHATAHLTENLRSRSGQMRAVTAALDRGDVRTAFEVLRPETIEAARDQVPLIAAGMWVTLPPAERENTLLLASGRAMRAAANATVQTELKASGELGSRSISLSVLDRVTVTREGARQERAYQLGHVVEFRTDLPSQQLTRGDRGVVVGVERGQVVLRLADGRHRLLLPDRLPRNLRHDAVSIYATKQVELHAGDRIRWTGNDHGRDMLNAGLARVETIGERSITVSSLADGTVHELAKGDRMLERLDLAYALNIHAAQGVTTEHGIVMMSAAERRLASEKAFLVAVTRIAEKATLVVDSGRGLERVVLRNPGEKMSAIEAVQTTGNNSTRLGETAVSRIVAMRERLARDPSLDLTALRVAVEPKVPDLPFPEKDISLEL